MSAKHAVPRSTRVHTGAVVKAITYTIVFLNSAWFFASGCVYTLTRLTGM